MKSIFILGFQIVTETIANNRIIRDGVDGRKNFSQIIAVKEHKVLKDINFTSSKVQNLYNWWISKTNQKPKKSDFDISNHLSDAKSYFLYSVLGPEEFHVRLLGEQAIALLGNRYKDTKITAETAKVDAHLDGLIIYLQKILCAQTAFWCEGIIRDQFGREKNFQSIDCPLWDDNDQISHIVGVMDVI